MLTVNHKKPRSRHRNELMDQKMSSPMMPSVSSELFSFLFLETLLCEVMRADTLCITVGGHHYVTSRIQSQTQPIATHIHCRQRGTVVFSDADAHSLSTFLAQNPSLQLQKGKEEMVFHDNEPSRFRMPKLLQTIQKNQSRLPETLVVAWPDTSSETFPDDKSLLQAMLSCMASTSHIKSTVLVGTMSIARWKRLFHVIRTTCVWHESKITSLQTWTKAWCQSPSSRLPSLLQADMDQKSDSKWNALADWSTLQKQEIVDFYTKNDTIVFVLYCTPQRATPVRTRRPRFHAGAPQTI